MDRGYISMLALCVCVLLGGSSCSEQPAKNEVRSTTGGVRLHVPDDEGRVDVGLETERPLYDVSFDYAEIAEVVEAFSNLPEVTLVADPEAFTGAKMSCRLRAIELLPALQALMEIYSCEVVDKGGGAYFLRPLAEDLPFLYEKTYTCDSPEQAADIVRALNSLWDDVGGRSVRAISGEARVVIKGTGDDLSVLDMLMGAIRAADSESIVRDESGGDQTEPDLISVAFEDVSLDTFLNVFARSAELEYVADTDLLWARVSMSFDEVPVRPALASVFSMNNLSLQSHPLHDNILVVRQHVCTIGARRYRSFDCESGEDAVEIMGAIKKDWRDSVTMRLEAIPSASVLVASGSVKELQQLEEKIERLQAEPRDSSK